MFLRVLFFFCFFSVFSQKSNTSFKKNKKDAIIKIGIQAYYDKDSFLLNKSSKQLYTIYQLEQDSFALAKYYHYKALTHRIKFNNDSAYYNYHVSKNISRNLKDSIQVGRRLLSMAVLQRNAKDYLGSEINSIEALHYLKPNKESYKFIVNIYNNLGIVSEELNQDKESIKYYNLAIKTRNLTEQNEWKEKRYLYLINNLGLLYQRNNNNKKAITYFQKGLDFDSIRQKYTLHYALLLENLAASNFLLGNKSKVLQQYNDVLEIRKKQKEYSELSTTHLNIADYYKDLKQKTKAKLHANKALKYAKKTHNNNRWLEALKNLSELTTGKESKAYLLEYITLNDSLFQKERQLKNQFAKIRYETDKKEKENSVLKTENEKKQAQIAYHKQQQTIGWLAAASILLLLILSITFFLQRRRKLLYQAQLEAARARENERQQIAKSLHDEVAGDLRMLHNKLEKSNLIEEAQKLNNVKDNVRNLSHQLSSVSFDEVSFKDQIINLVSDYFELDFKISVNGLHEYEWQYINDAIKRLLYLGIRESIQNCKKYAQASKIIINLTVQKNYVLLNITDNGIGFDTKISKKGIGLRNLQERVEDLNGTLNISSEIGSGTKTNIQIPLNAWTNKNTPS